LDRPLAPKTIEATLVRRPLGHHRPSSSLSAAAAAARRSPALPSTPATAALAFSKNHHRSTTRPTAATSRSARSSTPTWSTPTTTSRPPFTSTVRCLFACFPPLAALPSLCARDQTLTQTKPKTETKTGWGTSFHFAHRYAWETHPESIKRHEHVLALKLGLKPGSRVLDVGCGVGGPVRFVFLSFSSFRLAVALSRPCSAPDKKHADRAGTKPLLVHSPSSSTNQAEPPNRPKTTHKTPLKKQQNDEKTTRKKTNSSARSRCSAAPTSRA
jgi:hypothetical protein